MISWPQPEPIAAAEGDHPALAWRRAGLLAITGNADGPARICPAAITSAADAALAALRSIADAPGCLPRSGAALLGERARRLGLRRGGRRSANGSCRLYDTADGRIALNLARPDDIGLLAAWLEDAQVVSEHALAAALSSRATRGLLQRGRVLGLPIAEDRPATPCAPWSIEQRGGAARAGRPLAVDLSSLWAGPLAASLLGMAGAEIIKVESVARPDGARRGDAGFFDLLNAGKASVALDFASEAGRAALRRLIARADIVIEGSRPRALAQLGVRAAEEVTRGAIWVSITAHGRFGTAADRVGFGDDAGVEAGLCDAMARAWGGPIFAGDALADPLAGLHAALAAWRCWRDGQGALISVPLAQSLRAVLARHGVDAAEAARWQRRAEADRAPLYPQRLAARRARPLGADNSWALPC